MPNSGFRSGNGLMVRFQLVSSNARIEDHEYCENYLSIIGNSIQFLVCFTFFWAVKRKKNLGVILCNAPYIEGIKHKYRVPFGKLTGMKRK